MFRSPVKGVKVLYGISMPETFVSEEACDRAKAEVPDEVVRLVE